MKIVLRPRVTGPSTLFILCETVFIVSTLALALYLVLYLHNWPHASMAIGAGIFFMLLFKEAWPKPVPFILIDELGIVDRRLNFGLIRWEDILEAQIEVNGPFLCLRVQNPESYIGRLPPEQQKKMKFHQSLGFRMLSLDVRGLDGDLLLILEQIRKRIGTRQKSS